VFATFTVIVTLPPRPTLLEENCAVTPAGIPLAASAALELNPFPGVIEIAVAADAPAAAVIVDGVALSVKIDADVTVSTNAAVFDTLPLVPLIVIE
jgi:hypothetical protein